MTDASKTNMIAYAKSSVKPLFKKLHKTNPGPDNNNDSNDDYSLSERIEALFEVQLHKTINNATKFVSSSEEMKTISLKKEFRVII